MEAISQNRMWRKSILWKYYSLLLKPGKDTVTRKTTTDLYYWWIVTQNSSIKYLQIITKDCYELSKAEQKLNCEFPFSVKYISLPLIKYKLLFLSRFIICPSPETKELYQWVGEISSPRGQNCTARNNPNVLIPHK